MSSIQALLPEPGVLPAQQGEHQGWVLMDQLHEAVAIQREGMNRRDGRRCSAVSLPLTEEILKEKHLTIAVAQTIPTTTREFNKTPFNREDRRGEGASAEEQTPSRQDQFIVIAMLSNQLHSSRHQRRR